MRAFSAFHWHLSAFKLLSARLYLPTRQPQTLSIGSLQRFQICCIVAGGCLGARGRDARREVMDSASVKHCSSSALVMKTSEFLWWAWSFLASLRSTSPSKGTVPISLIVGSITFDKNPQCSCNCGSILTPSQLAGWKAWGLEMHWWQMKWIACSWVELITHLFHY